MATRTYEQVALTDHWLSIDLDAWTRHVVRRHFNPALGSPYWLKKATELSFDPMDITEYAQLTEFGPFDLGNLRGQDPADLVPLDVPRPLAGRVWESGGTTGDPVRAFYTENMMAYRSEWRRWSFQNDGFLPGKSWLQATPTGPHLIGNATSELSDMFASLVYGIDMDPRWVKQLIRGGRMKEVGLYTDHLIGEMTSILRTQRIHYVNTTPALLQQLIRRVPELLAQVEGVRLGGTHLSPEMYRAFTTALDGGIVRSGYGNTFGNGIAFEPRVDRDVLPYVPTYPQITMSVVDPAEWTRIVAFGETGQVRLTMLHEDLFLPNILERDQAIRFDVAGGWPMDGFANVRPLQVSNATPEGLY